MGEEEGGWKEESSGVGERSGWGWGRDKGEGVRGNEWGERDMMEEGGRDEIVRDRGIGEEGRERGETATVRGRRGLREGEGGEEGGREM